jgi:hypothetical protein
MNPKIEQLILGKKLKDIYHVPTAKQTTNRLTQKLLSKHPVRDLGWSENEGPIPLTEEDRESHIHILGSPGEGKSKFLELLLRQDIDNGYGACLLDPSDNGDTCYKILKYAISKGYEKIVLIDPHDVWEYGFVPTINPVHYRAPGEAVAGDLMDVMRVLWNVSDFSKTGIIEDYLPSIFTALHAAKMTLAESRWFRKDFPVCRNRRDRIVSHLNEYDDDRMTLEEVFSKPALFNGDYRSTTRRLKLFNNRILEHMLGSTNGTFDAEGKYHQKWGLNFLDLVSKGYVILVNLDAAGGVWGEQHQKFLGTLIMSEIQYAVSRLRNNGWHGRYYLYVDEVGLFATRKLANFLYHKRKSGLIVTSAHQSFDQFDSADSKYFLGAVRNASKIKGLFFTKNEADVRLMMKDLGFGGELQDREVAYTLRQTPKQNCYLSINKLSPVKVRLQDVPDVKVSAKELTEWKEQHYKTNPWYRPLTAVREEINHRFDQATTKTGRPYAPRPKQPVRPQRPSVDAPTSGTQDGADNQTPTVEASPVAGKRGRKGSRKNVERKKGVPAGIVRQHKQNDEPVGE